MFKSVLRLSFAIRADSRAVNALITGLYLSRSIRWGNKKRKASLAEANRK